MVEPYTYSFADNEVPIMIIKPDENMYRLAPKKAGQVKGGVQPAFAAQNLEDMVIYDVDREDCGECKRKLNMCGHFT